MAVQGKERDVPGDCPRDPSDDFFVGACGHRVRIPFVVVFVTRSSRQRNNGVEDLRAKRKASLYELQYFRRLCSLIIYIREPKSSIKRVKISKYPLFSISRHRRSRLQGEVSPCALGPTFPLPGERRGDQGTTNGSKRDFEHQ